MPYSLKESDREGHALLQRFGACMNGLFQQVFGTTQQDAALVGGYDRPLSAAALAKHTDILKLLQ